MAAHQPGHELQDVANCVGPDESSSVSNLYTIHSCGFCQRLIVEARGEDSAEEKSYGEVRLDPLSLAGASKSRESENKGKDKGLNDDEKWNGTSSTTGSFTIEDAAAGRDAGCVLSKTLLGNNPQLSELAPSTKLRAAVSYDKELDTWSVHFGWEDPLTLKVTPIRSDHYLAYTVKGDLANTLILREVPNIDPGSRLSFEKGREWLQKCRESHPLCNEQYTKRLPTRLLRLGGPDKDTTSIPLVEAKTGDSYAALTYCWGGDQDCKLTKEKLCKDTVFKAADLPSTILDAIEVARNLHIPFLWVDSLCIVQDDDVNKDVEIDKMADIYGNATLTISAANSASCKEGIFKSRLVEQLSSQLFKLPFQVPGKGMGSLFLAVSSKPYRPGHLGDDPTDYRAWTLQEHVLSPRILYYSYQHVYWLCRETKDADGGLGPRDHSSLGFGEGRLKHCAMNKSTGEIDPTVPPYGYGDADLLHLYKNPNRKWQLIWELLLGNYQNRRLTEPGDRLMAISAIGSQFALYMNTQFVAGLFAENLAVGMLWQLNGEALPRPQSYRAPSWSWAAIDSPTSVRNGPRDMWDYPTMHYWSGKSSQSLPKYNSVGLSPLTSKPNAG